MSTIHTDLDPRVTPRARVVARPDRATGAVRQAFRALHLGFVAAPLLAGVDKFFDWMVDWTKYLAPQVDAILPGTAQQFMYAVGVVEIAAGVLVAVAPRYGGYVVAAWLAGIIGNLVIGGVYWDIALRDVGLMLGAFALGRLADAHHRGAL
jgi:hypothetical protein